MQHLILIHFAILIACKFIVETLVSSLLFTLTITELSITETCLPAHNLSISGIEHGRLTTILLTLVCLMQNKRPVLITPLSLAGDFQSVQQFL